MSLLGQQVAGLILASVSLLQDSEDLCSERCATLIWSAGNHASPCLRAQVSCLFSCITIQSCGPPGAEGISHRTATVREELVLLTADSISLVFKSSKLENYMLQENHKFLPFI